MKNTIPLLIIFSLSTFAIPNKSFATKLISLKTEYFNSANNNFSKIYGSGAIFGMGGRIERDSGLSWGFEFDYFLRNGKPLDWSAKNSKKGLLVEGPDLSTRTGVEWNMDRTSTRLTIISVLTTLTYKPLWESFVFPSLSLKMGVSAAKEKFSGEYKYTDSGGWKVFKHDKSAVGFLTGIRGGLEFFRGPFRTVIFCGYNFVPSWSDLGYRHLGGFTVGGQILFTIHLD